MQTCKDVASLAKSPDLISFVVISYNYIHVFSCTLTYIINSIAMETYTSNYLIHLYVCVTGTFNFGCQNLICLWDLIFICKTFLQNLQLGMALEIHVHVHDFKMCILDSEIF